ncbi:MAG: hypothetical protein Q9226_001888 [Calogaya cf. arnoldii]
MNKSLAPRPIVIAASQEFEGNDGPWSSFTLRIGTPAQTVKVFVSTAGYQTWAVVPQGCIKSDGADCTSLRGGVLDIEKSTTWTPVTASPNGTDTFSIGLEARLGFSSNGKYGLDTVALGWPGSGGPSLDHQVIAGIAAKEFYLGQFGLNPRPTNFTNFSDPVPSFLSTLKDRSMIPSLSWAYTTGNQYRLNKVLGSLTLGGYDKSKFDSGSLTIPFNEQDARDLTVNVKTISTTSDNGDQRTELLAESFAAFIDSTIPYLYLPIESCRRFEETFGITWNENVQAYLVNDSLRASLLSRNPSVIFTLSNSTSVASPTVDIVLPYAAFDLIAERPLMKNTTRYFPLMRAANESQYTLGRTFLQEAYLIADYERRNFSISQCSWKEGVQRDIIPILSPDLDDHQKTHGLKAGALTGIILGSIVAMVGLALVIFYLARRSRRQHIFRSKAISQGSPETDEQEERYNGEIMEIDGEPQRKPELHGRPFERYEVDGGLSGHNGAEGSSTWPQELDAEAPKAVELPSRPDGG